jgi:hypothetical protein
MQFAGILHTNLDVLIQTHMYDLLICIILQSGIFPWYSYVVGKNMMDILEVVWHKCTHSIIGPHLQMWNENKNQCKILHS